MPFTTWSEHFAPQLARTQRDERRCFPALCPRHLNAQNQHLGYSVPNDTRPKIQHPHHLLPHQFLGAGAR